MPRKMTKGSVFDDVDKDVGVVEQLKIKAAIMDSIRDYIAKEGISQNVAAERMGVQRTLIDDIARGHISVFSIDSLVVMAARVNLRPVKVAV